MTKMKIKILSVIGTRPEAIKMAPLIKELESSPFFVSKVVLTAQHRDMLDQVVKLFDIRPDYDLDIMKANQDLFDITSKVLCGIKKALEDEQPDIMLVHGDTTTTMAASLAACYMKIPIGHVEAGLRTFDKYSPFPEEVNRKLTDAISDIYFAPTETARLNLKSEGVPENKIYVTGNTVIDALLQTVRENYVFSSPELRKVGFGKNKILLVTTHRRENFGTPLKNIYKALRDLLDEFKDIEIVFPVHKNPAVRDTVERYLGGTKRVHLLEPLDYEEFANLMQKVYLVLTDSGGLQEEAPSLGKPVLVLRETTERPEAVEAGTVRVVGTEYKKVLSSIRDLLDDHDLYKKMSSSVNPYGDGKASIRIVEAILKFFA